MKALCLIALATFTVQAETIVVSAERFDRPLTDSTGSVQYIGRDEIERSGAVQLGDLLKAQAGITTINNGSFGKSGSLFIRGTDSRHVLILIDGVAVNDPTSIAGEPRFEYMALSDVESVEILKGSQSALYGQQAVGGVIKITTLKKAKASTRLNVAAGDYGQKILGFGTSGKSESLSYQLSGENQEASGISSTSSNATIKEKDPYSLQTLGAGLQYDFKDWGKVKGSARLVKGSSDFDNQPSDDAQFSHYSQSLWSVGYEKNWQELKWNSQYQFTDVTRDTTGNYHYQAEQKKIETGIDYKAVGMGFGFQKDKANVLDSVLTTQKVLENKNIALRFGPRWESFGIDMATRYENYNLFDDVWSYRAGLNVKLKEELRLKSSYSTGSKSPGLYQLFGQYGNLNLKPEKSRSSDVGLLFEKATLWLEVNYFEIDYQNYINYVTSRYENVSGAEISGVEFIGKKKWDSIDAQVSYTKMSTRDHSTNRQLLRRPTDQAQLSAVYFMTENFEVNSEVIYLGRRDDVSNSQSPSYVVADLGCRQSFDLNKSLSLKIRNILDHDYQEIKGYQSIGRNFTINFGMNW